MDINIKEETSQEERRIIALQISQRLYKELKKVAYEKDMTLSATIRYIVETYLAENK